MSGTHPPRLSATSTRPQGRGYPPRSEPPSLPFGVVVALLILAVAVGMVCAAKDLRAATEFSQGRPTRDGVDELPVWSIERCTPEGCSTLPLRLEDGSRVLVIRRICLAMRDQAATQIRDRLVCRPEPEAVDRQLGRLKVLR